MPKINICASCHSSDIEESERTLRCHVCGSTGPFILTDEKEASTLRVRSPLLGRPQRPKQLPMSLKIGLPIAVAAILVTALLLLGVL